MFVRLVKGTFALALLLLTSLNFQNAYGEDLFQEGVPVVPTPKPAEAVVMPKLTDLARELSPSVVNVSVESDPVAVNGGDDSGQEEKGAPPRSLGSGFIVHPDGYIVTSNHVIDRASRVIVRLLDDKTDYPAEIVGKDAKTDIALLKIEAGKKLKPVYIGDSDVLEVGEWVVAIGNQFQLGQTVTAGIVSAKSRRVPTGVGGPYDAFIQTDASINPGSSGGPLFNSRGQVVGVNTAIFSPGRSQFGGTGFNIGIGFAIPINLVREVVTQLREHGRVTRGLLGVLIQRVDGDVAKLLSLSSPDGALVSDVLKGTPAATAGVQRRDVIVSFDGHPVMEHDDLPLMVARTPVGTTVSLEVIRNGKKLSIPVTIIELTEQMQPKRPELDGPDALGLVVETASEELARALGIVPPSGVTIMRVEPGSIADKAGLLRGDVIEEFDGQYFKSGDDWRQYVNRVFGPNLDKDSSKDLYLVLVRRREGGRYVVVKRPAPSQAATPAE